MRGDFDHMGVNILKLAQHVVRVRRYGLEANLAALRLCEQVHDPQLISGDDLGAVLVSVMKARYEGHHVDWRAAYRADRIVACLLAARGYPVPPYAKWWQHL
jgi:hypothetical protein